MDRIEDVSKIGGYLRKLRFDRFSDIDEIAFMLGMGVYSVRMALHVMVKEGTVIRKKYGNKHVFIWHTRYTEWDE